MSTTNKYGEPWQPREPMRGHRGGTITRITGPYAGDNIIGITETEYNRAMACVNALAGAPDPERLGDALRAAQAALTRIEDVGREHYNMDMGVAGSRALDECAKALELLKPFISAHDD